MNQDHTKTQRALMAFFWIVLLILCTFAFYLAVLGLSHEYSDYLPEADERWSKRLEPSELPVDYSNDCR